MAKGKSARADRSKTAKTDTAAAKVVPPNPAKSIILLSDGTGNSSAKLFKTNVWRLYEAVDLGPAEPKKQRQIAFYDDGVGSSAFRPLAMLGGIFGLGLKRNVLELYSYVCRNYDPHSVAAPESGITDSGDHIYGFGFSRGAFTMRLAIAMIADQGIIPYTNDDELQRKVEPAYEVFRRFRTRRAIQWLREKLGRPYDPQRVALKIKERTGYDSANNHRPIIRFIGVWDTVAAYGGPIVELTRAVDNWFYPLSMPDYALSRHVRRARHALALDDERDSFWPLLWDEVAEEQLRDSKLKGFDWIDNDRLQQVWFTGMHADVGGGYPDESLSYVSLLWMMEEARDCGLRTVDVITKRYEALVNSFGPIHDSRSGVGAYYRYQPRKIAAWLEPVRNSTLSLRDPEIRDEVKNKAKGLIRRPLIHESAIARIASGTDGYAPIVLPDNFDIIPAPDPVETAALATTGGDEVTPPKAGTKPPPLLPPTVRAQLERDGVRSSIATAMETAWDYVWRRRITYFANVAATFTLLVWPWLASGYSTDLAEHGFDPGLSLLTTTIREFLGRLILVVAAPLPDLTDRWTGAWAASPFIFLLLSAVIIWLRRKSASHEMKITDRARSIWHSAMPRIPPASAGQLPAGVRAHQPSRLEGIRNSTRFQRYLQVFKWGVLPNFFALLMAGAILGVAFIVVSRLLLPFYETGPRFCPGEAATEFRTSAVCYDTGKDVRADKEYVITFDVVEPWRDGRYDTDPRGLRAGDMKWLVGYAGAPLRRVPGAGYLQPIAEIRPSNSAKPATVVLQALDVEAVPEGNRFQARFKPAASGRLFLFANDAVSLFDLDYFYLADGAKNEGTAKVYVEPARGQ